MAFEENSSNDMQDKPSADDERTPEHGNAQSSAQDAQAPIQARASDQAAAVRDAGWEKVMQDPRMKGMEMPFDGKRMIYGGFATMLDA